MKIKPNYILIVISVLVLAMLVLSISTKLQGVKNSVTNTGTLSTSENQSTTTPANLNPASKPPIAVAKSAPSTTPAVSILSPAASVKWVIGQNNVITWSQETKFTGGIYLVAASTGATVGWINTSIGPHQTSYTWNTRDVFLSRTNPAKKDIAVGVYRIKIVFDGGAVSEISGPVFSIIYPSEVTIPNYDVHIKDFKFSTSNLSIKKGDTINFINDDQVDQKILLSGFPPIVVQSETSHAFDTSIFRSGNSYEFYSDIYPTLILKIIVQ